MIKYVVLPFPQRNNAEQHHSVSHLVCVEDNHLTEPKLLLEKHRQLWYFDAFLIIQNLNAWVRPAPLIDPQNGWLEEE